MKKYLIDPKVISIFANTEDQSQVNLLMVEYYDTITALMKAAVEDYMLKNNYPKEKIDHIKNLLNKIDGQDPDLQVNEELASEISKVKIQNHIEELTQAYNKSYYEKYVPLLSEEKREELLEHIFEMKQLERRTKEHMMFLFNIGLTAQSEEDEQEEKPEKKDNLPPPPPKKDTKTPPTPEKPALKTKEPIQDRKSKIENQKSSPRGFQVTEQKAKANKTTGQPERGQDKSLPPLDETRDNKSTGQQDDKTKQKDKADQPTAEDNLPPLEVTPKPTPAPVKPEPTEPEKPLPASEPKQTETPQPKGPKPPSINLSQT